MLLVGRRHAAARGIVATREQSHEIRVVAKNMTYYVGRRPPTRIRRCGLVPGEQVRVTFRNDDRACCTTSAFPRWVSAPAVVEFGTEKRSFTFKVPDNCLDRYLHLHAAFGDDVREDHLREVKWQRPVLFS